MDANDAVRARMFQVQKAEFEALQGQYQEVNIYLHICLVYYLVDNNSFHRTVFFFFFFFFFFFKSAPRAK
jgi:hypothetical protein